MNNSDVKYKFINNKLNIKMCLLFKFKTTLPIKFMSLVKQHITKQDDQVENTYFIIATALLR